MNYIESFVEGIAQDMALDKATDKVNEYAEKHVKTKDPYRDPSSGGGKSKKLKLRDSATKEEQKMWKWIQKRAWVDDKCFMGCYPVDCGIGLGPLVVAIPGIGPLLMYAVHARLVTRAALYFKLDTKTVAKLNANILFDLFLTFPPVIGSFFAWMNGCSTRNAAIIYTEITKMLIQREQGNRVPESHELHEIETQTTYASNPFNSRTNGASKNNQSNRPATSNSKSNGRNNYNHDNINGPTVPPRDYTTPQRPNKVYQSQQRTDASDAYRSVI